MLSVKPMAARSCRLKADEIDGDFLRTGAANFAKFEARFQRTWKATQPMIEFGPAIEALEPR
jgi:hypothetical protein